MGTQMSAVVSLSLKILSRVTFVTITTGIYREM